MLDDSNVGLFAGLKEVARYVRANHISDCWIMANGTVDPAYYGIPCKPLPAAWQQLVNVPVSTAPAEIDGTVFVCAANVNSGPPASAPWTIPGHPFHPVAVLRGEYIVLQGHFAVPALSATSHLNQSSYLLRQHQLSEALVESQTAAASDPNSVNAQMQCGFILKTATWGAESQPYFQRALLLAKQQKLAAARIAAIERAAK